MTCEDKGSILGSFFLNNEWAMGVTSRIAALSILAVLISPAGAHARGGYSHHKSFDAEHGTTADFLVVVCSRFDDVCRSAVSTSMSSNYWGCSLLRDQGVDENGASRAIYDWLRAHKARSRSTWSADVEVAFHAVYPACSA